MTKTYRTLSAVALWTLFLTGLVSILLPIILGMASGALAGTIFSIDDGKLWFYRHGLSFLIGIFSWIAFFYGLAQVRQAE